MPRFGGGEPRTPSGEEKTCLGDAGNDVIRIGGRGTVHAYGGPASDKLYGGAGTDTLVGGQGKERHRAGLTPQPHGPVPRRQTQVPQKVW